MHVLNGGMAMRGFKPDPEKRISLYLLALMGFSTVWSFGNVVNGFLYFNGVQAVFSWILMFALYFIPYALMVGELGSAFRDFGGLKAIGWALFRNAEVYEGLPIAAVQLATLAARRNINL